MAKWWADPKLIRWEAVAHLSKEVVAQERVARSVGQSHHLCGTSRSKWFAWLKNMFEYFYGVYIYTYIQLDYNINNIYIESAHIYIYIIYICIIYIYAQYIYIYIYNVYVHTCVWRVAHAAPRPPESSGESVMHPWMQRHTSQNDVHPLRGSPHPASEATDCYSNKTTWELKSHEHAVFGRITFIIYKCPNGS